MKKLLFFMMALLVSSVIMAQGSNQTIARKSFLAVHAGPAFPAGDFGKTNLVNSGTNEIYNGEAGFAQTGYNLNIIYGYQPIENFGITASVFYNNHKLDNQAVINQLNAIYSNDGGIDATGVKLDHWQWYGLAVGPMVNYDLAHNFAVDLRVMGGIANANSPRVTYKGFELVKEDWSVAPTFQAGLDLRIGLPNNLFILANVDYLYMKPKFTMNYDIDGEVWTESASQKMSVVNLTGGIGIRF